ncbi:DEAD/DEAH box helicase [Zavarzinia sp. CC-PAN008]|uniref:DEAD/DEAH box helicase n=1 Tax=Zavarzinia sp. CC-PAN008 TaxID=3243332 RepID=UPI003F74313E
MSSFSEFGLNSLILDAVSAKGYQSPTPIQAQSIPVILEGRDLCGIAQTGTGKTAAFALPILHQLAARPARRQSRGCRALILAPTRELCSQIEENFRAYGERLDLRTGVIFGGVSMGRQVQMCQRGLDIIVATPGRLLDLIDQRALSIERIEILVLDEADQMMDLGFIHPLRRIISMIPKERQTLFFSATMPRQIQALAESMLQNPVQVAVRPVATTAERVEQSVIHVPTSVKPALLRQILLDPAMEKVLVFTRTKHGADKVVRQLEQVGEPAAAIHGNKSQPQRERALAGFKAGNMRVLVATDIAARGIHVDEVSHVVNYDLPNVPESYVHRIGRTARAGAAGIAISFCNHEERAYLRDIERLTRQAIPVLPLPADLASAAASAPPDAPIMQQRGRPNQGQSHGHNQGGRPQQQPRGQQQRPQSAPAQHGRPQQNPRARAETGTAQGHAHGRPQEHGRPAHAGQGKGGPGGQGQAPRGGQGRPSRQGGGMDEQTGLPRFLSNPGQRNQGGGRR